MVAVNGTFYRFASGIWSEGLAGTFVFCGFKWIWGSLRVVFEIMDYGSHGKDRSKYRLDLNRGLYLQSQDYQVISISLDEMKENPAFIIAIVRSILAPYLVAANESSGISRRTFQKIERQLMRLAIRHNRIIRPAKAASELEIHKQTVIKYCRSLVAKGKFRAVSTGTAGRIFKYEYIGSMQSPDVWWL